MYEFDKIIVSPKEKCECLIGTVIEFNDKMLIAKYHLGGHPKLRQKANVLIYDDIKGEVEYEGEIKNTFRDIVVLTNLKFIQGIQRRNDTRVKVSFNLEATVLGKRLSMRVANLSSGGILLHYCIDIPKHLCLKLEIPIDTEVITCLAEIVRKEKSKAGFKYGCRFTAISERERDKIRGFVFRKQIEDRKGRLEA